MKKTGASTPASKRSLFAARLNEAESDVHRFNKFSSIKPHM